MVSGHIIYMIYIGDLYMKEAMVCMIFSCGAMYASTSSSFSEGSLSYSRRGLMARL